MTGLSRSRTGATRRLPTASTRLQTPVARLVSPVCSHSVLMVSPRSDGDDDEQTAVRRRTERSDRRTLRPDAGVTRRMGGDGTRLAYLGRPSEPDAEGRMGGYAAERRPSVGCRPFYGSAGDGCGVGPLPLNPAERLAALDEASFFFCPMPREDCESRRKSDGAKSSTERRLLADRRLASRRNSLKTVSQVF